MLVKHLDHLVLTTAHLPRCVDFYTRVLGLQKETFHTPGGGVGGVPRLAFKFGCQKINVHEKGKEHEPKAKIPMPGSLDLCFIASCTIEQVVETLKARQWPIEEGPVTRTGATGKLRSVYVRDPDDNLIELSEQL